MHSVTLVQQQQQVQSVRLVLYVNLSNSKSNSKDFFFPFSKSVRICLWLGCSSICCRTLREWGCSYFLQDFAVLWYISCER